MQRSFGRMTFLRLLICVYRPSGCETSRDHRSSSLLRIRRSEQMKGRLTYPEFGIQTCSRPCNHRSDTEILILLVLRHAGCRVGDFRPIISLVQSCLITVSSLSILSQLAGNQGFFSVISSHLISSHPSINRYPLLLLIFTRYNHPPTCTSPLASPAHWP